MSSSRDIHFERHQEGEKGNISPRSYSPLRRIEQTEQTRTPTNTTQTLEDRLRQLETRQGSIFPQAGDNSGLTQGRPSFSRADTPS